MQKRILVIITVLFSFYLINSGCSKLDTTDIGSDLLPAVDNVHTFAMELPITTTQGIFNPDSTILANTDEHVLGKINNDPLFGTTTANIYAQFKPTFYPYYYGNAGDTIVGFDSVVLCLSYKGLWGDSLVPMSLQVKEITGGGLWDSVNQFRRIDFTPPSTGSVVGNATIDFTKVSNYVVYSNKRDSARNHIRIKLSTAFANSLFARDTLPTGNNSFRTDSAFRVFNKGLAIIANGGGNGLMYTYLTDSMSRLEVHYRKKNGGAVDTTFSSFKMISTTGGSLQASVTANSVIRNRAGAEVSSGNSNYVYLQTSPGTYVNLAIPGLDTVGNKIIHRAEIVMEQVPNNYLQDSLFSVPDFLYMDLIDTGTLKWKPVYFDLNPNAFYDPDYKTASYFPSGGIEYFSFGGYPRYKADVFNNSIRHYNFNITRHVQQIVTKHTNNYTFRLFAPYVFRYPQYTTLDFIASNISGNNKIAKGRVRLGSGTNTNYRMKLRIVYSKI